MTLDIQYEVFTYFVVYEECCYSGRTAAVKAQDLIKSFGPKQYRTKEHRLADSEDDYCSDSRFTRSPLLDIPFSYKPLSQWI